MQFFAGIHFLSMGWWAQVRPLVLSLCRIQDPPPYPSRVPQRHHPEDLPFLLLVAFFFLARESESAFVWLRDLLLPESSHCCGHRSPTASVDCPQAPALPVPLFCPFPVSLSLLPGLWELHSPGRREREMRSLGSLWSCQRVSVCTEIIKPSSKRLGL